jgi:hypothetical protein
MKILTIIVLLLLISCKKEGKLNQFSFEKINIVSQENFCDYEVLNHKIYLINKKTVFFLEIKKDKVIENHIVSGEIFYKYQNKEKIKCS